MALLRLALTASGSPWPLHDKNSGRPLGASIAGLTKLLSIALTRCAALLTSTAVALPPLLPS